MFEKKKDIKSEMIGGFQKELLAIERYRCDFKSMTLHFREEKPAIK